MADTVQQLHELPDLAAEVYLTWGHPNPSEQPVVQVKRIHPRAPADLDTLDALRPDELGLLHRLAQCVRAVVEDMPEHPGDLTDTPTWAGECDWLITHANTWRADAFLTDLVGSEVHAIHRELCRIARIHPPLRLQCPRCQAPVHLAPGGQYYRCEAGHIIDHWAEIKRLGVLNQPVTIPEAAAELGASERTLQDWQQRGLMPKPAGRKGKAPTFHLDDLRRIVARIAHKHQSC